MRIGNSKCGVVAQRCDINRRLRNTALCNIFTHNSVTRCVRAADSVSRYFRAADRVTRCVRTANSVTRCVRAADSV